MNKLNLGSGNDYMEGWTNVEIIEELKGDVRHDLNVYPYPFPDNEFDEIRAASILEHLDKPIEALKEMIRIAKDGAKITIIVPHAHSYSAVTDLQHKTFFTENSFNPTCMIEYGIKGLELESYRFFSVTGANKWKNWIPFRKYLKIFFMGMYDEIEFVFKVKK